MEMKRGRGKVWQPQEIESVKKNYPDMLTSDLAKQLNRSVPALYHLARKLGLAKSQEFLESMNSGRLKAGDGRGVKCRFTKGHQVWNKGLKGFQAGGESKKTQFKK